MSRENRHQELNCFKTQIDLRSFMALRGYALDHKQSSRSYSVMRHANGDKLIVTRKANRHWIFANAHDDRDKGTIIDFIQYRDRCSLGEVRKQLRAWTGDSSHTASTLLPQFKELTPTSFDPAGVIIAWEKAKPINGLHFYLEKERKLPAAILADPIFASQIRTDQRGNALFAHRNGDGLCGFEIKNRNFTSMSPGGVKGLFQSHPREGDRQLIVCETAIDALSFAALFGTYAKRFVSTAGQVSPAQKRLLQSAARAMPSGSTIVLAMDNDDGGRKLACTITAALSEIELTGIRVVERLPPREGEDWNDVLRRTGLSKAATPTP